MSLVLSGIIFLVVLLTSMILLAITSNTIDNIMSKFTESDSYIWILIVTIFVISIGLAITPFYATKEEKVIKTYDMIKRENNYIMATSDEYGRYTYHYISEENPLEIVNTLNITFTKDTQKPQRIIKQEFYSNKLFNKMCEVLDLNVEYEEIITSSEYVYFN